MAAKSNLYTKSRSKTDVQDVLKDYYDVSHGDLDVIHNGQLKSKPESRGTINNKATEEIDEGTCLQSTPPIDPISGYNDKDHVTITITYSDTNTLTAGNDPSNLPNFVEVLTKGKKMSYNCIITVQKIDQCTYYNYRADPPVSTQETAKPLVKVDVKKYDASKGVYTEDIQLDSDVQANIRKNIEEQFQNCWFVWTYNGKTKEYWKWRSNS